METHGRLTGRLPALIRRIVDSYEEIGTINHLGHSPLPATEAVIAVAQDLKEVIFPGYRRRQNLHQDNVEYHVGDLIDRIHHQLTRQVARALRHEQQLQLAISESGESGADVEARAEDKVIRFLERLPELRRTLADDVQAGIDGDPATDSPDEIIFCYPGLEAITVYRLAHALVQLQVPVIPRVLTEWAHRETGIDINPCAEIGPSFFIDHGTGVVIGETCVIGSHVTLYQGVTLGALSFPRDSDGRLIRGLKRHPTIEDHVVIYSNASVLGGNTTVGANSIVGAGVSLTRSVPANTVVTVERPSLRFRDAA